MSSWPWIEQKRGVRTFAHDLKYKNDLARDFSVIFELYVMLEALGVSPYNIFVSFFFEYSFHSGISEVLLFVSGLCSELPGFTNKRLKSTWISVIASFIFRVWPMMMPRTIQVEFFVQTKRNLVFKLYKKDYRHLCCMFCLQKTRECIYYT